MLQGSKFSASPFVFFFFIMPSKKWISLFKSLQIKKYRREKELFFVEGRKNLLELFESNFEIEHLFLTEDFIEKHLPEKVQKSEVPIWPLAEAELLKMGTMQSNNAGIALVKIPHKVCNISTLKGLVPVLAHIQDPGNLGTIVRICDWYGLESLICSADSVDLYNYKSIHATMGSFGRVSVYYEHLEEFIPHYKSLHPDKRVYAALMAGQSLYQAPPAAIGGLLLMGNEAQGLSEDLARQADVGLTIPRFGAAESLNVGIATAIIIDHWRSASRIF